MTVIALDAMGGDFAPRAYVWVLTAFACMQPLVAARMGARMSDGQLRLQEWGMRLSVALWGAL